MPGEKFTFRKDARIRKRLEFESVKNSGQKLAGRYWHAQWIHVQAKASRLGVITTRKSGLSHERARLRRLVREFFRLHRMELCKAVDLVIVARAGSGSADSKTLRMELATLWYRIAQRLTS